MNVSSLKPYAPWVAALGLGGLVVAAVVALIYRQFNTGVQVSLVVGLIGLVLAVLFNPGAVTAWMGGRQARYGANALVMSLALLGILVLVNYIVERAPSNVRFFDWSEGQVNTLAPESIEALRKLPQPVKAIGFYTRDAAFQQDDAKQLLDKFRDEAPDRFSYEFVDPNTNPVRARAYEIDRNATLVLEMGDQREQVNFASETEITSALVRFAVPQSRTLYFLTGHGERITDAGDQTNMSVVAGLLEKQNYVIQPLNLAATDTVPADARAVIIAGPVNPFSDTEVSKLSQYLQQPNTALIALLDPPAQMQGAEAPAATPLEDYLKTTWGVTARNDLIVDFARSIQDQPLFPAPSRYGTNPITERLQGFATFFPLARSLEYTTTVAGLTTTSLVETSDQSWGETDIASLNSGVPQPGDPDALGPLTVAVAVENTNTKSRVVVFGDSDFASDAVANEFANANLFVNSVNWATLDETLINLTPKTPTQRSLQLIDSLTANAIFFFTVIAMPLLVLVLGGVVWFTRRRHT